MIDIEAARQLYSQNDSAHGFDHVLRVLHLAERIAMAEGADVEIVRTATLLHDISRAEEATTGVCHAQAGARLARRILAAHPPERVERVAQAIAQHRFRGEQGPSTIEAQTLYDGDKLDALGAIGVARAYAVAGRENQHLWAQVDAAYSEREPVAGRSDLEDGDHTPVHEYLFKLVKLKDRLYTDTGRRIAQSRHDYMVGFFRRLDLEVRGEL